MEKEKKQKHSLFCCFVHNKKRKTKDKAPECTDNQNSTVYSKVTETNKNIDNNTTTKNEEQFTTELNPDNTDNPHNTNTLITEPNHSVHSYSNCEQYVSLSQIDCIKIISQDITSSNSISNANTNNNLVNIDNNDNTYNTTVNNSHNISKTHRNISPSNTKPYNTYSRVKTCVQEPVSIPFTTNILNDIIHNKDNNNNTIHEGNAPQGLLGNASKNRVTPNWRFSFITPNTNLPKHSHTNINNHKQPSPLILNSNRTDPHVNYIPHIKNKFSTDRPSSQHFWLLYSFFIWDASP